MFSQCFEQNWNREIDRERERERVRESDRERELERKRERIREKEREKWFKTSNNLILTQDNDEISCGPHTQTSPVARLIPCLFHTDL